MNASDILDYLQSFVKYRPFVVGSDPVIVDSRCARHYCVAIDDHVDDVIHSLGLVAQNPPPQGEHDNTNVIRETTQPNHIATDGVVMKFKDPSECKYPGECLEYLEFCGSDACVPPPERVRRLYFSACRQRKQSMVWQCSLWFDNMCPTDTHCAAEQYLASNVPHNTSMVIMSLVPAMLRSFSVQDVIALFILPDPSAFISFHQGFFFCCDEFKKFVIEHDRPIVLFAMKATLTDPSWFLLLFNNQTINSDLRAHVALAYLTECLESFSHCDELKRYLGCADAKFYRAILESMRCPVVAESVLSMFPMCDPLRYDPNPLKLIEDMIDICKQFSRPPLDVLIDAIKYSTSNSEEIIRLFIRIVTPPYAFGRGITLRLYLFALTMPAIQARTDEIFTRELIDEANDHISQWSLRTVAVGIYFGFPERIMMYLIEYRDRHDNMAEFVETVFDHVRDLVATQSVHNFISICGAHVDLTRFFTHNAIQLRMKAVFDIIANPRIDINKITLTDHVRVYDEPRECELCTENIHTEFVKFANCIHTICHDCAMKLQTPYCPFCREAIGINLRDRELKELVDPHTYRFIAKFQRTILGI